MSGCAWHWPRSLVPTACEAAGPPPVTSRFTVQEVTLFFAVICTHSVLSSNSKKSPTAAFIRKFTPSGGIPAPEAKGAPVPGAPEIANVAAVEFTAVVSVTSQGPVEPELFRVWGTR